MSPVIEQHQTTPDTPKRRSIRRRMATDPVVSFRVESPEAFRRRRVRNVATLVATHACAVAAGVLGALVATGRM